MKIGAIVMRCQEDKLHTGHKYLIEKVQSVSDKVVILLGCCVPKLTRRNPLDFETRKMMVKESFSNVTILPVYDNKSDEQWSENLDDILDKLSWTETEGLNDNVDPKDHEITEITLHHSRDSFRSHYSGDYPCKEWDALGDDNATEIRNKIGEMGPWAGDAFRRGVIYASQQPYPKVYATVDMFVYNHKTNKFLAGRRKNSDEWRLLGGFSDPTDGSFKITARRELKEESGLNIPLGNFEVIDSFKIDDWRYRNDVDQIITTLFWVDYDGDQECKGADDIEELQWVDLAVLGGGWSDKPIIFAEEHKILLEAAWEYGETVL